MERHSKEKIISIEIYTDGSLKKQAQHTTFGGWAYIAVQDSKKIYFDSGSEYGTTNQRMELTAIVKALQYAQSIRKNCEKVIIYSDSAYAINCYTQEWYLNWQANGWVTSEKKEVANKDLWFQIIPFFDNFWYSFKKVPAHQDNFWNNKCDEMAQAEAEKLKKNWRGTKHYGEEQ